MKQRNRLQGAVQGYLEWAGGGREMHDGNEYNARKVGAVMTLAGITAMAGIGWAYDMGHSEFDISPEPVVIHSDNNNMPAGLPNLPAYNQ
jgi:hypothetical protein